MMKRFFYYAVGDFCARMAMISAQSVRRTHADAWITLATDQPVQSKLFDLVVPLQTPVDHRAMKRTRIAWYGSLKVERGLALDCDTYIADDLSPLFDLLDDYDVAAAYDARWLNMASTPLGAFMNAGVIGFRRCGRTDRMWRDWLSGFDADPHIHFYGGLMRDQGALERALQSSRVRLFALPPEYNLRAGESFVPMSGRVRIIHSVTPMAKGEIEAFAAFLNSTDEARCYFPASREMLVREVTANGDGLGVAISTRALAYDPQPLAVASA